MALSGTTPTSRFAGMDITVDLDRLLKPELDTAKRALLAGNADWAENCLNSAAATCRMLGVKNTSPRYRRYSSAAAHLRHGEEWVPESEE